MERHVTSLPIPNNLKVKLVKGGIQSVNEMRSAKPTDLCKDCGLTKSELQEISEALNMSKSSKLVSAYELLQREDAKKSQIQHISLLSNGLDSILGGGISLGKITEVCGAAGVGKTQLCMQLCISIQLPTELGGMAAKAVYVDTEGSFVRSRVVEMTRAIRESVETKSNLSKNNKFLADFTTDKILKNIYYTRCHDHVQLVASVNNLRALIQRDPSIKLVIIDSIASPFRFVDFKDTNSSAMKTNMLNDLINNAHQLISNHNIAFLIINQMTTRIVKDSLTNTSSSSLVPALGETWAHAANIRLLLSWKNTTRLATVVKCSYLPETPIPYIITSAGLCDYTSFDEDSSYASEVANETGDAAAASDELGLSESSTGNQVKRKRP